MREQKLWREEKMCEEEKDICRYVRIRYTDTSCYNGRMVSKGKEEALGLQVNDKIYLTDGRYKRVSTKGLKIIEVFSEIPEWSTCELRQRYEKCTGKGTLLELMGSSDIF